MFWEYRILNLLFLFLDYKIVYAVLKHMLHMFIKSKILNSNNNYPGALDITCLKRNRINISKWHDCYFRLISEAQCSCNHKKMRSIFFVWARLIISIRYLRLFFLNEILVKPILSIMMFSRFWLQQVVLVIS